MAGGIEMGAAGLLPEDDGRIAGNVLADMMTDDLRGHGQAAGLRANDNGNGLAFVEIGLCPQRRRGQRDQRKCREDTKHPDASHERLLSSRTRLFPTVLLRPSVEHRPPKRKRLLVTLS